MKLLVLGGCAVLLVVATALPRWRLELPLLDIQTLVYEYDGELSDEDLGKPGCREELEAAALERSDLLAWVEGPLLWPLATHTFVAEYTRAPGDDVHWVGLTVDGVVVADATRENGGIVERDGGVHVRLEAPVDALSGRHLEVERLYDSHVSRGGSHGPPLVLVAWGSLGSLRRPGGR